MDVEKSFCPQQPSIEIFSDEYRHSSLLNLWSGRDCVGNELDSVRGEGWGIGLVTVGLGICLEVGVDLDISC